MKLNEIWDEALTRSRYLMRDTPGFLLQLLVWALGIFIIAFFATKEFCEKRIESIKKC